MADNNTTWDLIATRIAELEDLYARMDETRQLLYMEEFKLKSWDGKHNLDNVINITGNGPAVLANAVVSDLMGAKWQVKVEGNIPDARARDIELFVEDNFAQADEFLLEQRGQTSLNAWLASHVATRSYIGVRWITRITDGKYVVDCLPVDMRWTPFRYGTTGLQWVAPITRRPTAELVEEFGQEDALNLPNTNAVGRVIGAADQREVRDFWDSKTNQIWVDGASIKETPNTFGTPPFVIVAPSVGFMLRDEGYLKHEAEDLFFLNRNLYKEWNRILSVEQTFAFRQLYPAFERETEQMDGRPAAPAPKTGEVRKVKKGELARQVPLGDMNQASQAARADFKGMLELGGISDAELGSAGLNRPGIWFTKQFEIRQKMETGRLEAIKVMKEGLARLMIAQFQAMENSGKVKVGRRGAKHGFTPEMLGDPEDYSITIRFMVSSKTQEIMNMAQATAALSIAPEIVIVRDILKAEDPEGWIRQRELDAARRADPAIALFEMALQHVEEADRLNDDARADAKRIQSKMLTERGVALIRARQQPMPPEDAQLPQPEEPRGSSNPLTSLLGSKGLGAGGIGNEVDEGRPF